jgi:hypothetical protein
MNTISTDEKTLTRFLLGDMPEAERERIESSLIFDTDLHDRIAAVEFDLVDDYVRGRLSGVVLAQFESFYLSSALNRERVRLARELPAVQREHRAQAAAARLAAGEQVGPAARELTAADPGASARSGRQGFRLTFLSFIDSLRPAAPYAVAGLLAVAALTAGWILFGRNGGAPVGSGQIARVEQEATPPPAPTHAATPQPSAPPDSTPSPTPAPIRNQQLPTPTPPTVTPRRVGREGGDSPDARQPSVVALALVSGLARGEGSANTLVVPRDTDLVRLDVALPRTGYRSLRAEIETVEGRKVWSGQVRLPGGAQSGRRASVTVPARLLDEDDYLLILTGAAQGGEQDRVESFYFKALRK